MAKRKRKRSAVDEAAPPRDETPERADGAVERSAPTEAPPDDPEPLRARPEPSGGAPAPRGWLAGALARAPQPSFLEHVHPRSVQARSLEAGRTLGLGLLTLYSAVVLTVTGVLLMVYYVPSAAGAYGSIQDLHAVVPFGGLVRNVHRWAGHAMVLLAALHMLRTLLTGSYKDGRHGVWTTGVWLLVLTLAFAFTGYLLPWDQLAFWAVSIGGHLARNVPAVGPALSRALLGGEDVTGATLVRFYALHVGILPLLTTGVVALHLYRLRRAGGLARPRGETAKLPAWPHLYEREIALGALALAVALAAGVLFEAPLGPPPDLAHPDNPSKAPWYFLGLQELVSYSSLIGGVVIPGLSLVALYLVPRLDPTAEGAGEWLAPRGGRLAFAAGCLASAVVFPAALALHERADPGATGVLTPAALLLLSTAAVSLGVGLWRRSARLAVLALAGAGAVGLLMLTAVGIWMRGPSWALLLPWGAS